MRGINRGQRLVIYAIPEASRPTCGHALDIFPRRGLILDAFQHSYV